MYRQSQPAYKLRILAENADSALYTACIDLLFVYIIYRRPRYL